MRFKKLDPSYAETRYEVFTDDGRHIGRVEKHRGTWFPYRHVPRRYTYWKAQLPSGERVGYQFDTRRAAAEKLLEEST